MKTSYELRKAFIDYFTDDVRRHRLVPSSPLVPPDDPTLLFTTAGMVQFKPFYAGTVPLPYTRACSVQKCLRAGGKGSDLENVGKTLRHHTFFEMLGNFSFGDYFKREALQWAWEFSTEIVGLDPSRIYASIYEDDDESWEIWTKEIGLPESHMVRLGAKDNFWGPAGDTGACGPCSELYYDRGEKYGPGLTFQEATLNDHDPHTRYIEFWNCVFPQYDQQKDGSRLPLKNRGVDTGMGLERLTCIVQEADSPYETDLLAPIVEAVCSLAGVGSYYSLPLEAKQSVNVVADHIRALVFALSEGILPSNDGRGYVLRRLLRRAARYARRLGQDQPFMYQLVDKVVEVMGGVYPEITEAPDLVKRVVRTEEESYAQTLGTGLQKLEQLLEKTADQRLGGEDVFLLVSTYGLPYDDICEVARDRGIDVDTDAYLQCVQRHKEESRKAAKGTRFEAIFDELKQLFSQHGKTRFLGYAEEAPTYPLEEAHDLKILALFRNDERVLRAAQGESVAIVLEATPFYAESGGQVADTGVIITPSGRVRITDVQKSNEEIFVHYGTIEEGEVQEGQQAQAVIDLERRWDIMRNHTATHLLQGALKAIVGKHVTQQGSYVGPEYLRFDFTNPEAVTGEQLAAVERVINEQVMKNLPVRCSVMELEEARKTGAIAPFGERYGALVRVIDVMGWDIEFCGGTHVLATGCIGPFVIISESAVAAGVRRIEATAGRHAVRAIQEDRAYLKALSETLCVPKEKVMARVESLLEELRETRKDVAQWRSKAGAQLAGELLEQAPEIRGVKVVVAELPEMDAAQLREMYDHLKSRCPHGGLAAVLSSASNGRVTLIAGFTRDVVDRGLSAAEIVKAAAQAVGGSGGGKKEMAQAGGKNPEGIPHALKIARTAIEEKLS
ncbi:MAG: alanine--tRNA ligase [Candidatus Sumerlaeaceae bacterium]|nr:alanine--tRNA ligase [Candidatus Sumerlaeaceae bacterium]